MNSSFQRPGVHAPAPLELFTTPHGLDDATGIPQVLAQYPNADMFGIAAVAGGLYKPWMNGTVAYGGPVGKHGFTVRDTAPSAWDVNADGQKGNALWLHHAVRTFALCTLCTEPN